MAAHNELGTWGEEMAVRFLERKGYTILERDWKSGHRDIDIIATDGEIIVFVEVKTRRNRMFGEPEEAISTKRYAWMPSLLSEHQTVVNRKSPTFRISPSISLYYDSLSGAKVLQNPEITKYKHLS